MKSLEKFLSESFKIGVNKMVDPSEEKLGDYELSKDDWDEIWNDINFQTKPGQDQEYFSDYVDYYYNKYKNSSTKNGKNQIYGIAAKYADASTILKMWWACVLKRWDEGIMAFQDAYHKRIKTLKPDNELLIKFIYTAYNKHYKNLYINNEKAIINYLELYNILYI